MIKIAAIATGLPKYRVRQEKLKEKCRGLFRGHRRLKTLLGLFEHSGVEERYFAFPMDYYLNGHTFAERNRDYITQARKLGKRVVQKALRQGGYRAEEIDQFYFVTTTGLATPSIDALLAADLGFRPDIQRSPLFGMGCAGGAAALGRAAQAFHGKTLILSIELCGQTFRKIDRSLTNAVGAALFGDGAAAVILDEKGPGPEIVAWGAELFPGTPRLMGWDFLDDGFKLVLSQSVPRAISRYVVPALQRFVSRQHLSFSDIQHFLLHPGGAKVLKVYEVELNIPLERMHQSLRRFGNLSSAHVLFLLDDLIKSKSVRAGERGLVASVGPGFTMEALLLQWSV